MEWFVFGAGGTQTVTLQSLETGCDSLATLTLTVTPSQVPDFDQLGPYCQDDPADALPNISIDGITGVWGPPVLIQMLLVLQYMLLLLIQINAH